MLNALIKRLSIELLLSKLASILIFTAAAAVLGLHSLSCLGLKSESRSPPMHLAVDGKLVQTAVLIAFEQAKATQARHTLTRHDVVYYGV